MNTSHACLPMPIDLGRSPLQRLSDRLGELWCGVAEHLRRAARERAERRRVRAQDALYASLDARTLRDIGLGDFAGSARDDDASIWRRGAPLRGF